MRRSGPVCACARPDRVVLLADPTRSLSRVPPAFEAALNNPRRALVELVLYRDHPSVSPSQTFSLMKLFGTAQHHHLRSGVPRDFRRRPSEFGWRILK